jgi:hypothetical protein
MKITTPTATLGIRGTTGLVEVPVGAAANNPNNVAIKLYPDADGRVGRIEVNDRAGARLGFLTQGASGFTIRGGGAAGMRFAAVPLTITPQQIQRDQGFVRQVHSTQNLGRRVVDEQRAFRRANPGVNRDNAPRRQPQNALPGQNRTGPQQPGLQNRPGQPQPGSPQQPGVPPRPGQPQQNTLPGRPGGALPRTQMPNVQQPPGQPPRGPQQPGVPGQPGAPQPGGQPPTVPQQGQPRQGDLQQRVPGVLRPGSQNRPALAPRRLPPPPKGKLPKLPR